MTNSPIGRSAVLLLLTLAFAAPASAQRYTQQVRDLLDEARSMLSGSFSLTHDYEIDNLDDSEEDSFTLSLDAGRTYAIVGVCDEDCSDLDFWLYDEDDNLIDSDTSTDDVPMVHVTPSWSGPFRIRVKMYECSTEPCYYGIGVFGD